MVAIMPRCALTDTCTKMQPVGAKLPATKRIGLAGKEAEIP
jgi:hypothetical protein